MTIPIVAVMYHGGNFKFVHKKLQKKVLSRHFRYETFKHHFYPIQELFLMFFRILQET